MENLIVEDDGTTMLSDTATDEQWDMTTQPPWDSEWTTSLSGPHRGGGGGVWWGSYREISAAQEFRFYATIALCVVGILCNGLSLMVFLSTSLRRSSYGHYLSALAISDSVMLATEFVRWISDSRFSYHWLSSSTFACKFVYHLRYSSQIFSTILTTTITIERFFVVAYPLKSASLAKTKIADKVIFCEGVICILLGLYGSILFELISITGGPHGMCLPDPTTNRAAIYGYCNLVLTKILGEVVCTILVFVFTILLIRELMRSKRIRENTLQSGGGDKASSGNMEAQLTAMLLTLAVAFVVLRVPYTVCWYLGHYGPWRDSKPVFEATQITYVFSTANFTINFFLYSFSGSNFRKHLYSRLSLICPVRKKVQEATGGSATELSQITSTQTSG